MLRMAPCPLTIIFETLSLHLRLKGTKGDFASVAQDPALSLADLCPVDLQRNLHQRSVKHRTELQRTKVPFVDRSLTTTEVGSVPSHRMIQCLLPKNGARPKRQKAGVNERPKEKYERTDSHSGQTNCIIVTTANCVTRLYPPKVELLEPWTAWKQKSPQVGVGIKLVWLRLRELLSGQLSLLSLLELLFMEIGLVVRASH